MEIINYWFCLLSIQHFPFKDHAVILGKKDKKKLHMSRILMHLLRFECIAVKWKEHVPSLKCMNISRGRNHDIKNSSSFNIWITTLVLKMNDKLTSHSRYFKVKVSQWMKITITFEQFIVLMWKIWIFHCSSECGVSFYWGPAKDNFDSSLFWNCIFTSENNCGAGISNFNTNVFSWTNGNRM